MNTAARSRPLLSVPLSARTTVELVAPERGREILGAADAYVARLSPFDLAAKMQGRQPLSVAAYLAHARAQVRSYRADELEALAEAVATVGRWLAALELCPPLPATVEVVCSTLAEEGGMNGYTRGTAVVLRQGVLDPRTFAHELFHLVTRHHPGLRERLYRLLGVRLVRERTLPPAVERLRVTNPDAPANDAAIVVHHRGRRLPALMVILARSPYQGGPLRPYLQPSLIHLDGDPATCEIFLPEEVEGLWQQLGTNTTALAHPEEISAEHFAMLLSGADHLPRPELLAAMYHELRIWRW